ncbi:MAG: hypothetical protein JRF63_13420, partial [Deltaproteobacteria bacterium]|nr:hypothetical protein [Deltaproteobacteria bacterium]
MSLGETIGALRRIGASWLALAVGGGLAAGVGTCLALIFLLPDQLAQSLLPYAAGAADGLLLCLAIGSLRDRALRRPLVLALVAVLIAAAYLSVLLVLAPDGLAKRWFGYWAPSLGAFALVVWVVAAVWERRAGRQLAVFTAIIAGLALSAMLLNNASPVYRALSGEYIRSWNVYHYYVGAKYFAELGYTDLYAATLLADDEWRERKQNATAEERRQLSTVSDFGHIRQTRDMRTYLRIPRKSAVADFERTNFSDERWEQLGKDTRALRAFLDDESWRGVLTDLGFNPSPAWTVLGTPVANLIPI